MIRRFDGTHADGAHKTSNARNAVFNFNAGPVAISRMLRQNGPLRCRRCMSPMSKAPSIQPYRDSNHQTNSGDRILVSKLAYIFSEPKRLGRHRVQVCRSARMNYIKRCIGIPTKRFASVTVTFYTQSNDVRTSDSGQSATPGSLRLHGNAAQSSMRHSSPYRTRTIGPRHCSKQGFQAHGCLILFRVPMEDQRDRVELDGVRHGASTGDPQWIRFRHRVVDPLSWRIVVDSGSLPTAVPPTSSRLVAILRLQFCV